MSEVCLIHLAFCDNLCRILYSFAVWRFNALKGRISRSNHANRLRFTPEWLSVVGINMYVELPSLTRINLFVYMECLLYCPLNSCYDAILMHLIAVMPTVSWLHGTESCGATSLWTFLIIIVRYLMIIYIYRCISNYRSIELQKCVFWMSSLFVSQFLMKFIPCIGYQFILEICR